MNNTEDLLNYFHTLNQIRCSSFPDSVGKEMLRNEAVRVKEKFLFELSLRQNDAKILRKDTTK